jgi:dephospho-CoA kinase
MRKIITILGLPGSGKTEAINYLENKYKWPKVYFGEVTFEEMKKRGLEMNQENEKTTREDLRKKFGFNYYAEKIAGKIENIPKNTNVLVESLYDWYEYLYFKKKFGESFITLAIYASPKLRYERLAKRSVRPLTSEEAQKRDYAQIENLRQGGPIAMADYTIENNGKIKEMYQKIDAIINN